MEKRDKGRTRQVFWLDYAKPDESDLAEYIDQLKAQRKFVTTIKQGLRLIRDLREGRVDVLIELFPHLRERLQRPDVGTPVDSFNTLLQQLSRLERQITTGAMLPSVPLPTFSEPPSVKVVENIEERKKLSVANSLAAIADF